MKTNTLEGIKIIKAANSAYTLNDVTSRKNEHLYRLSRPVDRIQTVNPANVEIVNDI